MKRCQSCGNIEAESARFCSSCGRSMEAAARYNPFRQEEAPQQELLRTQPEPAAPLPQDAEDEATRPIDSRELERIYQGGEQSAHSAEPENDEEDEPRSRTPLIILGVVLALVLMMAALGVVAYETLFNSSSRQEAQTQEQLTEEEEDDSPELSVTYESQEEEQQEDTQPDTQEESEEELAAQDEEDSTQQGAQAQASLEITETETAQQEDTTTQTTTESGTTTTGSTKTFMGVTITGDYVLPNSSTVYLTESDLQGLSSAELRLARNEIYARHGRIFTDSDLKAYFESCSWYKGTVTAADFDSDVLNSYEVANLKLLKSYEAQ